MEKHLPNTQFLTESGFRIKSSITSAKVTWPKNVFLLCSFIIAFAFNSLQSHAQVVPPPQYFVSGGTGSNSFPFNTNTTKRTQFIYLPGDLPNALPGNILKVYFRASTTVATSSFSDFRLRLGQTTATTFPGAGGLDFFTNLTTVISATTYTIQAPIADGWVPIDIPIPFLFNPAQTLIVEVEMSDRISGGISLRTGNAPSAPNHKRLTATSLTATTGGASTIFHDFGIDVGPSIPCSGTPNAGTAISSAALVCPNTSFQLSLTGNTFASGITYQWQSSPNGTTGWTNITGATNPNFTATQTSTNHYRAQLTCGTATSNSVSVMVTTNATPVTGTYTINKNQPTAGTNFDSFADAITFFECGGLSGPITFNVVANTGPYNEQVVVPTIPGTSATNTITFNGNGNTIVSTTGTNKGAITLNGTDFTKFDNFIITLDAASTTGWGVQLMNDANNNTISNCTINLPLTSTSTDISGIVSGATTATAGSNTNNSKFQNNTINGGYYGIRLNGATGGLGALNNQITGNTISDFYTYGVYLADTDGTLVEGNNISRPNRTTVTTFNGVYMVNVNKNCVISKNRIHNSYGAATTITGQSNGINSSSSDAPAGSENIVKNNLIYDMNNTGITYGIFNTGSDGVYYYHNTFNLDNTNNTNTVRGFFQTTAASNIKFMNNIVAINAGSASTKHALYFNTPTSAIISNNNVLYVNPTATNHYIGFHTTNFTTLVNWKTANAGAYDQNSVSGDPQFTNVATGNFTPMSAAINNAGTALTPPVTDDILGLPRNPNSPDAGAYEFMNNAIDVGVTAILTPNSVCGLTNQETITVTVTNFGTTTQSNIPLTLSINNAVLGTETLAGPLAPGASVTYTFTIKGNLSLTGGYTILVCTTLPGDQQAANNCTTKLVTNSAFSSLPIIINFETPATGLPTLGTVTNSRSAISENVAASLPLSGQPTTSTKGLIMEGIDNPGWQIPVGLIDPWTNNPEHFSAIKMCFNPAGGNPNDPLYLIFDLKQLYKTANANTNLRVTVNGTQVGPTYRPPFSGTPIDWQKVYVDLSGFKNALSIELALESSVKEGFANGAGTANLLDNIRIVRFNPTGIKPNVLESQLSVYPNPSAGVFTVKVPEGVKTYELQISDLTGKTIQTQKASETSQLDLRHVAKGIYLLKVVTENGSAVKRLVIE